MAVKSWTERALGIVIASRPPANQELHSKPSIVWSPVDIGYVDWRSSGPWLEGVTETRRTSRHTVEARARQKRQLAGVGRACRKRSMA